MRAVYHHLLRTYGGVPGIWLGILLTLLSHLLLRVVAPLALADLLVGIVFGAATLATFVNPAVVLLAGYLAAYFGDLLFMRATDSRYRALVGDFYVAVTSTDPILLARRSAGENTTMFRDHLDGTINLFRLFRTTLLPAALVSFATTLIVASFSLAAAGVFAVALATRGCLAADEYQRGERSRKASKVVYDRLSTLVGDHVSLLKLVLASAPGDRHLASVQADAQRESELFWVRHWQGATFQFVGELLLGGSLISMLLLLWPGTPRGADLLWQSIVVVIFVLQGMQGAKEVGDAQRRCSEHWSKVAASLDSLTAAARPALSAQQEGEPADGALAFEGVTLTYPRAGADGPRVVLDSLTFKLPSGTHFAIVGANGAGKTTVVNLLMRFTAPTDGVVSFGGVDLSTMADPALYANVGYVPQGTSVLHDTIEGNVRFFEPEADEARLREVLDLTGVTSLLQLRGATEADQAVGDRGAHLSGGEQQRIALARALLRPARLYILDEPTSAIEAAPAAELVKQIRKFVAGRTLALVTHSPEIAELFEYVLRVEEHTAYWQKGDPSAAQFDFGAS